MTPYRQLPAPDPPKQKPCFLFHDWSPVLKAEAAVRIASIIMKPKKYRALINIDVFEDYKLVCSSCGKENKMTMGYVMLAIQDTRSKFKDYWGEVNIT